MDKAKYIVGDLVDVDAPSTKAKGTVIENRVYVNGSGIRRVDGTVYEYSGWVYQVKECRPSDLKGSFGNHRAVVLEHQIKHCTDYHDLFMQSISGPVKIGSHAAI